MPAAVGAYLVSGDLFVWASLDFETVEDARKAIADGIQVVLLNGEPALITNGRFLRYVSMEECDEYGSWQEQDDRFSEDAFFRASQDQGVRCFHEKMDAECCLELNWWSLTEYEVATDGTIQERAIISASGRRRTDVDR